MLTLWQDVRYAARNLQRSPDFTVAAVATLTLAIGAATVAFTMVDGILLAPLPFEEPDRLVSFLRTVPERGVETQGFPTPVFADLREQVGTLEGPAAYVTTSALLDQAGPPERLGIARVSAGFFDILRVRPVLGRLFSTEDDLPDGTLPAVASFDHWQQRWGGDPDIIGRVIRVEDLPALTVIGVLPSSFRSPSRAGAPSPVWIPMEVDRSRPRRGGATRMVARLKDGESLSSAGSELDTIAARLADEYPETDGGTGINVVPLFELIIRNYRRTILIFTAAVGALLLIGVLNLVNLQASRISKRERELSIRTALGASRWRLIRQMIVEATVLTGVAAAIGLGIAYTLQEALLASVPLNLPRMDDLAVDGRAFAFAAATALLAGVVIGLVPAFRASRVSVNDALKDGTPGSTESRHQRRLRGALTIVETSLAIVLLVGAGILIESFWKLVSVEIGFDPGNVTTARLTLPQRAEDRLGQEARFGWMLGSVRALPGAEFASLSGTLPMESTMNMRLEPEGLEEATGGGVQGISGDYGRVMRIPLLAGRWITDEDVAVGRPVAVVTDSMARLAWQGRNPIGRQIRSPNGEWHRVVGMVPDVRASLLREPTPSIYVPYNSALIPDTLVARLGVVFVLRSSMPLADDLERAIQTIEPDAAVNVRPMEEIVARQSRQQRFQTVVLSAFAATAVILAMLGIYSVVAFSTAQRTREVGLRLALGAGARDVVRQMMRQGVMPAAIGLGVGIALASTLSGFLAGLNGSTQHFILKGRGGVYAERDAIRFHGGGEGGGMGSVAARGISA